MHGQLRISTPKNGDILNHHDGSPTQEGLAISVAGIAAQGRPVSVVCEGADEIGGVPRYRAESEATAAGTAFSAAVKLHGRHNTLTAISGEEKDTVQVLWDRDSFPRYRLSLDDNILLLKDLAQGSYRSLFDHWYLAFWRSIHHHFGTKVHLNIYHQTDPSVWDGPSFQLPLMPDRFRGEWQDNADWLRLSFHAWQHKPDRPYKDAGYDQVARDYERVMEQIRRFAGQELTGTYTTVHWAETTRDGARALRDRGVKGLIGGFDERQNAPFTRYYLSSELADYVATRDYWWDPDMDMIFVSCDMVVDWKTMDAVLPRLQKVSSSPHTSELIELIVHEYRFRKEQPGYQADIQEKVLRTVEWVSERGYRPVFWSDGFVGA